MGGNNGRTKIIEIETGTYWHRLMFMHFFGGKGILECMHSAVTFSFGGKVLISISFVWPWNMSGIVQNSQCNGLKHFYQILFQSKEIVEYILSINLTILKINWSWFRSGENQHNWWAMISRTRFLATHCAISPILLYDRCGYQVAQNLPNCSKVQIWEEVDRV